MSKWEMMKLGEVFSLIRNGASIKQGVIDGGYPITRIETIANSEVNRNKMGYAGITDISKYSDYVLQTGDILMSHINSEKHLGKTACYEQKQDEVIIHGMNLLRLRPIETLINCKYAYYFFQSNSFKHQIPNITKKSVNQASFTVTALKELTLPLPPLENQKQIAKTLDTAAELLAMRKQQLAELDNLIKSIFYDMFGDPVTNEKGWEVRKLSKLATIKSGGTPARSHPEYFEGEIPWITTVALGKTFIDENDAVEFINENAIEHSATKLIKENSLLFGIRVGVGKISINKVPMCTNQDIVAIVDVNSNLLNQVYLVKTINTYADYFNKQKRGATIQGIKSETLKSIDIPLPPLKIQTQFAEIVTKIEEQKALVQKVIDETQYLFDSLMSEYFE